MPREIQSSATIFRRLLLVTVFGSLLPLSAAVLTAQAWVSALRPICSNCFGPTSLGILFVRFFPLQCVMGMVCGFAVGANRSGRASVVDFLGWVVPALWLGFNLVTWASPSILGEGPLVYFFASAEQSFRQLMTTGVFVGSLAFTAGVGLSSALSRPIQKNLRKEERVKESVRLQTFSPGGLLTIGLAWVLLTASAVVIHQGLKGVEASQQYWYVDSALSAFAVSLGVLLVRPRIAIILNWRLQVSDAILAVTAGFLLQSVTEHFSFSVPPERTWFAFIGLAIIIPVLEEFLLRGVFLGSLTARVPAWFAVIGVALVAAIIHFNFWPALIGQMLLNLFFLSRNRSLPAVILFHIAMNATLFLNLR